MSEQKPAVLNPATAWSIQQAGSREKALEFLDGLSEYTGSRDLIRKCLKDDIPFNGPSRERGYFNYLLAAQRLIDELYPLETRS